MSSLGIACAAAWQLLDPMRMCEHILPPVPLHPLCEWQSNRSIEAAERAHLRYGRPHVPALAPTFQALGSCFSKSSPQCSSMCTQAYNAHALAILQRSCAELQ